MLRLSVKHLHCFIPAKHKRFGYKIKFVQFHKSVIFSKFYLKGVKVPVRNISVGMQDRTYNVNKLEICSKLEIILKRILLKGLRFFFFDFDPCISYRFWILCLDLEQFLFSNWLVISLFWSMLYGPSLLQHMAAFMQIIW